MIFNYHSLIQLRAAWETMERESGAGPRTTVLVLDRGFAGHLPSLIRRKEPSSRLILASADGPLPALAMSELAHSGDQAGWSRIECVDDWRRALDDARQGLCPGEELAFFWPAWRDQELAANRPSRGDTMSGPTARPHRAAPDRPRGTVA